MRLLEIQLTHGTHGTRILQTDGTQLTRILQTIGTTIQLGYQIHSGILTKIISKKQTMITMNGVGYGESDLD